MPTQSKISPAWIARLTLVFAIGAFVWASAPSDRARLRAKVNVATDHPVCGMLVMFAIQEGWFSEAGIGVTLVQADLDGAPVAADVDWVIEELGAPRKSKSRVPKYVLAVTSDGHPIGIASEDLRNVDEWTLARFVRGWFRAVASIDIASAYNRNDEHVRAAVRTWQTRGGHLRSSEDLFQRWRKSEEYVTSTTRVRELVAGLGAPGNITHGLRSDEVRSLEAIEMKVRKALSKRH